MTADYVLVTTTTDTAEEAQTLADTLVTERLAACAHIEQTDSVYWWAGEVQRSHEWRVEFKTTVRRKTFLMERIKELHSYEVPQLIATEIADGSYEYLSWITAETTPR